MSTLWEVWLARSRKKQPGIAQGAMVVMEANNIDVPQ